VLVKIGTALFVTGILMPVAVLARNIVITVIDAFRDKEFDLILEIATLLLIVIGTALILLGGA